MPRAVIFANGILPDLEAVHRLIDPGDTLIAADGGTHHALALGFIPAVLIGDLDSLTAADRRQVEAAGAVIRQHPRDKNETDLELALQYAVKAGFREIVVTAALGGRLDQTLGNLFLLTRPEYAALDIRMDDGVEAGWFVYSRSEVHGQAGDLISLIPWNGEAAGVTTEGLRWPLMDETLYPDRTRGISNELLGEAASVALKSGRLLLVHRRSQPSQIPGGS